MKKVLLSLAIIWVGCYPAKIRIQSDAMVDFMDYTSWCWLDGCEFIYEGPSYLDDSSTYETIGNAIAVEMQRIGFVQRDDADLLVDFHIVVREDSAVFARVHEEDLPYWNDYEDEYYHFLRGTLIIDVIDKKMGRVIWQSTAQNYMALYPEIDQKAIRKIVRRVFKKFPPRG